MKNKTKKKDYWELHNGLFQIHWVDGKAEHVEVGERLFMKTEKTQSRAEYKQVFQMLSCIIMGNKRKMSADLLDAIDTTLNYLGDIASGRKR